MRSLRETVELILMSLLALMNLQDNVTIAIESGSSQIHNYNDRPWLSGTPTTLPLLSKTPVSHDTDIYNFGLRPAEDEDNQTNELTLGIDVCSCLLVSSPQNRTLVRPYTPVSSRHQRGSFSLLVKKYPDGAMGREFLNLKSGDSMVFWQIPFNKKIQYPFQHPKTILMLAAGTGITPMYQALNRMFGVEEDEYDNKSDEDTENEDILKNTTTRVILLYASRSKKDIYLKKEMENMKKRYPNRLEIVYMLSDDNDKKSSNNGDGDGDENDGKVSCLVAKSPSSITVKGQIDKTMIEEALVSNDIHVDDNEMKKDSIQAWVCGPPSFYTDICGPRDDPQNVLGMLKELGFTPNQVIKF